MGDKIDGRKRSENSAFQNSRKKFKKEDNVNSDPLSSIVPECIELVFQHLLWHQVTNLSLVSTAWAEYIHSSRTAMKRTSFLLQPNSYQKLLESTRRYQSIKVSHDDVLTQQPIFLSPILNSLQSLRYLSFQGTFDRICIEEFFNNLSRKTQEFYVEHLTFYGNVNNLNFLLRKFTFIKEYKTITLIALKKETFRNIITELRTKKLIIRDMKLKNFLSNAIVQNNWVNELHLPMTKVDTISVKVLIKTFGSLNLLTIENWDLMKKKDQRDFVKTNSSSKLRVRVASKPPDDHFLLLSSPSVQNLIFQHFTSEELLKCSLVSKIWFNLSKAKISETLRFNLNSSMITKRNYVNIDTTLNVNITSLVRIHPYTSTLRELTLELKPKSISNLISLFSLRQFNNLKFLNVSCHESSSLDDLELPTSLEFLSLSNFFVKQNNQKTAFMNFLTQARDLNDLQFTETEGLENLFMTEILDQFNFKLRRLVLFLDETNPEVHRNFQSFLQTQAKSLEALNVNQINGETLNALLEESCLSSLEVRSIGDSMKCIESIHRLEYLVDLQVSKIENFEDVEVLLKIAPKLRKIHLFWLTEECLRFLQANFKFLQEIYFTKRQKLIPVELTRIRRLKIRRSF